MSSDAQLIAGMLVICTLLLCAVLVFCLAHLRAYMDDLRYDVRAAGHSASSVGSTIARTYDSWRQYDGLKIRVATKTAPLRGTKEECEAWEATQRAQGNRTERF